MHTLRTGILWSLVFVSLTRAGATTAPATPAVFELRPVADSGDNRTDVDVYRDPAAPEREVRVIRTPLMATGDIEAARPLKDESGPGIDLTFGPEAGEKMRQVTTNNLHKRVAVFVEGKFVSCPTIQSAIGRNAFILLPNMTEEERNALLKRLKNSVADKGTATKP